MIDNIFKHKETGAEYKVTQVSRQLGIDIVFYIQNDTTTQDIYKRVYCRDLYKFLDNMELLKDNK